MSKPEPTTEDPLDPKPTRRNILSFFLWGIAIASAFALYDNFSGRAFNPLFFGINTVVYGFFSFLIKNKLHSYSKADRDDN